MSPAPTPAPLPAFLEARRVLDAFLADREALDAATRGSEMLTRTLREGRKVLICGNGGSLCDAAHFAEELTGRFRADRPPLAAIACTEPGHLTCTANDYGFDQVFARWVHALGAPGDALVLLSTSGASANIARAVDAAKAIGMPTIALLGKGGGPLRHRCTVELIAPGETSDRIQEIHMLVLHTWVEEIERALFPA
jgi:D-sedoheptulose 7-phosphate isomerase